MIVDTRHFVCEFYGIEVKHCMKILVINGPNLNFLGIRNRAVYGNEDYGYLVNMIKEYCAGKGIEVE